MATRPADLTRLLAEIRACRICRDTTGRAPLPHEPRPVLRVTSTARIVICGQAPGLRVHQSGKPFTDPSGDRLRAWMGVNETEFYDERRIAIVPMGFCFPGYDAKGADLPPRPECAPRWQAEVFSQLRKVALLILVGGYAQRWHLDRPATAAGVTATVRDWRIHMQRAAVPCMPLPHPSWRNNGWLRVNPWFDAEAVPALQVRVRALLGGGKY